MATTTTTAAINTIHASHDAFNKTHFPPTPSSDEMDDLLQAGKNNVSQGLERKLRDALTATRVATSSHLASVYRHDRDLEKLIELDGPEIRTSRPVEINGEDLSHAEMVAVSWFKVPVQITKNSDVRGRIDESVDFLARHLAAGEIVYGINTGYGGSADTRSADFLSMQRGLIQHHNSAVLLPSDIADSSEDHGDILGSLKPHCLPRTIVRGSMLARCNSLLRGHSAVRLSVIENIVELLNQDCVPIIPLRGTVSASGDLTPLSYIAGALEGNPDIYLDCRLANGQRSILNAKEALENLGLKPTVMLQKEGLGLMNGTAVSCAAASLALHETQYLTLASQVLTGMCTEALLGSSDNYHPFISRVRPHAGQIQVAENISRQLENSKLVVGTDARTAGLYQDRYALRTAPQWLGPQLEDIMLATQQVEIELNSTTDNPLIDVKEEHVHHGGNFQAASVTSAMEKTRLALQMVGKLMFAQTSELINPMLNKALAPNLCFDDPDVSFSFKGVDINMAAYMSELAYLANPVSSHVQSAEMHNQAVNSLAFISTRYTMDAVEMVSLMTATYLYTVCQGLDLHVLSIEYITLIQQRARAIFDQTLSALVNAGEAERVWSEVVDAIRTALITSKSQSTSERARSTAEATVLPLTKAMLKSSHQAGQNALQSIEQFVEQLSGAIETSIRETRARFAAEGPTTPAYLGTGSLVMYQYIRKTLNVSLHRGLVDHPTYPDEARDEIKRRDGDRFTIGGQIGVIYKALRSGKMRSVFIESLS